jgi:hypothetical protein
VEQKHTIAEHLSTPLVSSGVRVARSLVFRVLFRMSLFVCLFVCLFVFFVFFFLVLFLLVIALSVHLRFMASDYLLVLSNFPQLITKDN